MTQATLNYYLKQIQRLIRDSRQQVIDPGDLIPHVNEARREIAMRAQCIRRLVPITGAVMSASVVSGGSGYSNSPTVTITAPDFPSGGPVDPNGQQATATAIVQSGSIAGVQIDYGGAGYWQPSATITDATGTGASVTLVLSPINQLNQGQEVYNFSDVDLSMFPGVDSIYWVQSVSILFSGFRYSLALYDFSTYQAKIRQWAQQWEYVPAVCAQYGQGTNGSLYMYPIASQAFQQEWDCLAIPQDLETDLSVEAIPAPWTDAVPYYALHLSYLSLQNFNAAKFYLDLYNDRVSRYSRYARPGRRSNPYGRFAGGM